MQPPSQHRRRGLSRIGIRVKWTAEWRTNGTDSCLELNLDVMHADGSAASETAPSGAAPGGTGAKPSAEREEDDIYDDLYGGLDGDDGADALGKGGGGSSSGGKDPIGVSEKGGGGGGSGGDGEEGGARDSEGFGGAAGGEAEGGEGAAGRDKKRGTEARMSEDLSTRAVMDALKVPGSRSLLEPCASVLPWITDYAVARVLRMVYDEACDEFLPFVVFTFASSSSALPACQPTLVTTLPVIRSASPLS